MLFHLLILSIWFYLKPNQMISTTTRHISISIQNRNSSGAPEIIKEELIEMKKKESQPENKIVQEPDIKKQTKTLPDPNILPDEYHSGDEVESANQTEKAVTEIINGSNVATEKTKVAKQVGGGVVTTESHNENESVKGNSKDDDLLKALGGAYNTFNGYDDETNNSVGEEEKGLKSNKENITEKQILNDSKNVGNYSLLTDTELGLAFVKDPYSERRGKELKLINVYSKQVADAILANWINPLSPSEMKDNVLVKIRFYINGQGFIVNPYVYLQSSYSKLDLSFLVAIKSLMSRKFDFHKSYLEKYKYFTLTWEGNGTKYELMPFEKDKQEK